MSPTTPDLAELRRLAKAVPMPGDDPDIIGRWWDAGDLALYPVSHRQDREFIQACSPDVVLALLAERDALAAKVERVRELHIATPFWQLTPEGYAPDMESTAPDGAMCLACSEEHVTDDFENWELDLSDSGVVHYPCPTIRALDEEADA